MRDRHCGAKEEITVECLGVTVWHSTAGTEHRYCALPGTYQHTEKYSHHADAYPIAVATVNPLPSGMRTLETI